MDYTIHRGQFEIGGMCIEVISEGGTRILLDLGMPLVTPDGGEFPFDTPQRPTGELIEQGVLRRIPGLYPDDPMAPSLAGIVLTHAHLDHWGLVHHAHPEIPIYGSDGTISIIEVGHVFFPDSRAPVNLHRLVSNEALFLGDFKVTMIPVDHAAPDSQAVLVEADGQRLFYSGDLRAHGRTGFHFENILKDERLRGVDWLLIEGTTLGTSSETHGLSSESDVEAELVSLGRDRDSLIAVVASGQNVDRLVSCFRAARRTGRLLVIDPYQAYVLLKLIGLSERIPQFTWDEVRVSFSPYQVQRLRDAGMMDLVCEMSRQAKVTSDELAEDPGSYLLCSRSGYGMTKVFDKVGPERVKLVWSMWSGYWKRDTCAMREWSRKTGSKPSFVHSGGHAWPEDLGRLVKALDAGKVVWVHTDAPAASLVRS